MILPAAWSALGLMFKTGRGEVGKLDWKITGKIVLQEVGTAPDILK